VLYYRFQLVNSLRICVVFSFAVNIRNLAMEKVAEQVEFPCRFTGCTALLAAGDKRKHEKLLNFRSKCDPIAT